MNLKEWAETQGVHPKTAYGWFRQGKLPVRARRVGGLILVDETSTPNSTPKAEGASSVHLTSSLDGTTLAVGWADDSVVVFLSSPDARPRAGFMLTPDESDQVADMLRARAQDARNAASRSDS